MGSYDVPTPAISFAIGDTETGPTALVVTATSSNPTVVPPSGVAVGGSGTARFVWLTPTANQVGTSQIVVTVSDGSATAQSAFTLSVNPVNDAPVAVADSYTVASGQTLDIPAGTGVLANDTDVELSPLQAHLLNKAQHGSLTFRPDGSFTYTPAATFVGVDTFTYRASEGVANSSRVTVTITVTGTACAPRPRVVASPAVGGGTLVVHIVATPFDNLKNNALQQIQFGALQNATVTLNGEQRQSGQSYVPPPNTFAAQFTVERVQAGAPTMVYFTVVDACGPWKTFVGAGAGTGF